MDISIDEVTCELPDDGKSEAPRPSKQSSATSKRERQRDERERWRQDRLQAD